MNTKWDYFFFEWILVCFVTQEQGSQAVHGPVGSGADGNKDLLLMLLVVVGCAVLQVSEWLWPLQTTKSTGRISGTKCLWHQRLKRARRGRFCGYPAPNPLIDFENAPPRPYGMMIFVSVAGQKQMFLLAYKCGFSRYLRGCWIFTSLSPVKYCASYSVFRVFLVEDSTVSCWAGLWMCISSPFQRHPPRSCWVVLTPCTF